MNYLHHPPRENALDSLIDMIYEAAAIPELWSGVLERVSKETECFGGMLMTVNSKVFRWTASPNLKELTVAWISEGWMNRNSRAPRMLSLNRQGFIHEFDAFSSIEEINEQPEYKEFLHPRGFGWGAGTFVPLATADTIVFSIERRLSQGPVPEETISKLNSLRPHLARAALLSLQLNDQREQATLDAIGLLGIAAISVAETGRVVGTNSLISGLSSYLTWLAGDRLRFVDPKAGIFFARALETIRSDPSYVIRSFPLRAPGDKPSLVVHVIPVRRQGRDVFTRSDAIVAIVPASSPEAPEADLLQGLFDLTPAEARTARLLAQGQTLAEIASGEKLSIETIRSQLRAVFQKSGTVRQSELVALLNGLTINRKL